MGELARQGTAKSYRHNSPASGNGAQMGEKAHWSRREENGKGDKGRTRKSKNRESKKCLGHTVGNKE